MSINTNDQEGLGKRLSGDKMCLDFLIKPEEEAAVNFISQYFA